MASLVTYALTCGDAALETKCIDNILMFGSDIVPSRMMVNLERGLNRGIRLQCRAVDVKRPSSFVVGNKFQLDDVLEAQQFDRDILNAIFEVAREMEGVEKNSPGSRILKGYLMATLFYEPSTRTRLSFESAMKRLGGEVLTTENAREFSSAAKGETLEDTIRTVEGYSDIIVMRHFESGAAKKAAVTASIPVINAGDGPGQHPTQALLDMYTIQREIGRLDGIKVGLVGDLANGRTVRSLAYLLARYKDVTIYFVSPDVVKMKDDIKDYLTSTGVEWEESTDLVEVASKCDVVYQTRIQRERFGERMDLYEAARGKYIVDKTILQAMQKHAVVLHPLPRLDEITVEVDDDPRAAYFRQAKNERADRARQASMERVFGNERVASTAEEFQNIAEENAEQGIGSQTADEVEEAPMRDASGDIDVDECSLSHSTNLASTERSLPYISHSTKFASTERSGEGALKDDGRTRFENKKSKDQQAGHKPNKPNLVWVCTN